jgi:hypothetical protein
MRGEPEPDPIDLLAAFYRTPSGGAAIIQVLLRNVNNVKTCRRKLEHHDSLTGLATIADTDLHRLDNTPRSYD